MPWYFRTLDSWRGTLDAAGVALARIDEPGTPAGEPLSLLMTCTAG
jgi:hypothetical protein